MEMRSQQSFEDALLKRTLLQILAGIVGCIPDDRLRFDMVTSSPIRPLLPEACGLTGYIPNL